MDVPFERALWKLRCQRNVLALRTTCRWTLMLILLPSVTYWTQFRYSFHFCELIFDCSIESSQPLDPSVASFSRPFRLKKIRCICRLLQSTCSKTSRISSIQITPFLVRILYGVERRQLVLQRQPLRSNMLRVNRFGTLLTLVGR